jgi:hypothetical protein
MWFRAARSSIRRSKCTKARKLQSDGSLTTAQFKAASAQPPPEMQISKGAVAFMMESSRMFTIADWAWNSEKKHEHDPKMWYVYVESAWGE